MTVSAMTICHHFKSTKNNISSLAICEGKQQSPGLGPGPDHSYVLETGLGFLDSVHYFLIDCIEESRRHLFYSIWHLCANIVWTRVSSFCSWRCPVLWWLSDNKLGAMMAWLFSWSCMYKSDKNWLFFQSVMGDWPGGYNVNFPVPAINPSVRAFHIFDTPKLWS